MSNQVTLSFDPRRDQVHGAIAAAMEGQDETLIEQGVADAIMAACILGEVVGVESDEEQYLVMIRAALPSARKAAQRWAVTAQS